MRNIITTGMPGESVTVTGSKAEQNYNGDNHVVGPIVSGVVKSETLGTTDLGVHHNGGFDTFLINQTSVTKITMEFTFPIYSLSFDYEIFPNSSCAKASNCSSWPDFTFEADDQVIFQTLGIVPPLLGFANSPFSGTSKNELAPQFLGQSGQLVFADGVTKLEFIDWPVLIGIDNLVLQTTFDEPPPEVPVPATLLLFGTGLLAAAMAGRIRGRA
jgi:hypothetical protein